MVSFGGREEVDVKREVFRLLEKAGLVAEDINEESVVLVAPSGPELFHENGFAQVVTESRRSVCFLPGQRLKPHFHDSNELFHITRGMVEVTNGGNTRNLTFGDDIKIDAGSVHSLHASEAEGVQFYTDEPHLNRSTTWA